MSFLAKVMSGFAVASLILSAGVAEAKSRASKKFGVGVSYKGDPYGTDLGYQVKFNVNQWLQIFGGYGQETEGIISVKSFGGGARVFLWSDNQLAPYIGGSFSRATGSADTTVLGVPVSVSTTTNAIAASAGLDFQAMIGLNLGAGVNYYVSPSSISDDDKLGIYFHGGWFF